MQAQKYSPSRLGNGRAVDPALREWGERVEIGGLRLRYDQNSSQA
jgi:hypothetical protein